jgi:hypothetical protein
LAVTSANVIKFESDRKARAALFQIQHILQEWVTPNISDEAALAQLRRVVTDDVRRAAEGKTAIDQALRRVIAILDYDFPTPKALLNFFWGVGDGAIDIDKLVIDAIGNDADADAEG